jgi:predicted dehydrogenase
VDVINEFGVTSTVTLTYRFASQVRTFIAEAQSHAFRGGRSLFLTNAYLGGPFATRWRLEQGSILDTGPHAIDFMQAAVGPVAAVTAVHGRGEWTAVTLEHFNGAVTQVSLCSHVNADPLRIEIDLFNEDERRELDVTSAMGKAFGDAILGGGRPLADAGAFATLRAEFAGAVRNRTPHELDAAYGLRVQRVIAAAVQSIASGERVVVS